MLASYPGARLIFADSQTTQGSARDPLTNCAKMLRCLYLVDSPGAVNINIHAYTCILHTAASCLTCLFCLLYEFPTNHSCSVKSLLCLHDPVLSQVKNVMETSRSFPPAGTLWPSAYLGMYLGSCWCHASKEEPPFWWHIDFTIDNCTRHLLQGCHFLKDWSHGNIRLSFLAIKGHARCPPELLWQEKTWKQMVAACFAWHDLSLHLSR